MRESDGGPRAGDGARSVAARNAGGSNWGYIAAVVAITVLLFAPGFDDGAPEMDEGTLVSYPHLVSEGLVPGRDFETFYGPAQPYVMAAVSDVVGYSLSVERASGLLQRVVIALAIFALLAPVGPRWGLLGATAAGVMLLGLGLQGLAILGGIACLLVALAILAAAWRARPAQPSDAESIVPFALAGLAAAAALSFRPDLLAAVFLGTAPLVLWRRRHSLFPRATTAYLGALIVGLIPLLLWAALVGPDDLRRLLEDLAASRDGRHLALPGLGSVDGQLLAATVLITAVDFVVAASLLRRDRFDGSARLCLAIALLLIALLPSALQRADSAHILPVAAIAVGLLPITIAAIRELRPRRVGVKLVVGACGLVAAVGIAHQAEGALRSQVDSVSRGAQSVRVGDRSFRVDDAAAAANLNALLPRISRLASPGDSIFVGPADLTRTNYTDTFIYYLFPDLRPASFYTEVNPGTTNAEDSSLPAELEDADFVLLTSRYDDFADTDAARKPGSTRAQRVLDNRFCLRDRAGTYSLFVPCETRR